MTLTRALTVLALVALAAPHHVAARSGAPPCELAGTWFGQVGGTPLLATYANVVGMVAGTSDLDLYGDPSLGGVFPATRTTSGRGVWSRVHPAVYHYQFVTVGMAADNTGVYQLKVWGTKTLAPNCGTMEVTATLDIFAPWQDPLGDESPFFGSIPGLSGTAKRMPF
jgi:hypothetical protein